MHSATKFLSGHGDVLGGVVCGTTEFIRKTLEPYMKHTGGSMSPFTSWIMLNGMATLDLRCRAMADAALLAAVAAIITPIAIQAAAQVVNQLRSVSLLNFLT